MSVTNEEIEAYKTVLSGLSACQEEKAREFLQVIEECERNLTDAAVVMLIKNSSIDLVRWSIKPVAISVPDFVAWAKNEKEIYVYYDVPGGKIAGKF